VRNPFQWFKRERIQCATHGDQEFTLACVHICNALEHRRQVGFHWDPEAGGPRPEAWCADCEQWMVDHPDGTIDEVMKVADFQRLCVRCWDEAKELLDRK